MWLLVLHSHHVPGLMSSYVQVRLCMLYALRFEQDGMRIRQLQDYLVTAGVRDRCVRGSRPSSHEL